MFVIAAGSSGTCRAGKYSLTDEEIALSFSIYFNWGYPDYVREALKYLLVHSQSFAKVDPNRDLTWAQLNRVLAEADSRAVRLIVAGNPATATSVLNFLANTRDSAVVQRVAENPNTHIATLTRLLRHSSPTVRIAVGEHQTTPESLLLILANDCDPDVRYALAENGHIPRAVLQVLTLDDNPYVAARAERTLFRLEPAQIVQGQFSKRTRTVRINHN